MLGRLKTPRLELVLADEFLLSACLQGPESLAVSLAAMVPGDWPPEHIDEGSLNWSLKALAEGRALAPWGLYFLLLRGPAPEVIGTCGFKGQPDARGVAELGYSVVPSAQRNGYATEAVEALIACAFESGARGVAAETLPHLNASLRVMEKCGICCVETASEEGVLRRVRYRAN